MVLAYWQVEIIAFSTCLYFIIIMEIKILLNETEIITEHTICNHHCSINHDDFVLLLIDEDQKKRFLSKYHNIKSFSDFKESIIEIKEEFSFILVDNEGGILFSGDFNNRYPIYYLFKDSVLAISFNPLWIVKNLQIEINNDYFALRILNYDSVYPFNNQTPWKYIYSLNSKDVCMYSNSKLSIKNTVNIIANKSIQDIKQESHELITKILYEKLSSQNIVSADLSGGLDSTTLCYLIKSLGFRLKTVFLSPEEENFSDCEWSRKASSDVSYKHSVFSYSNISSLKNINFSDVFQKMPFGPSESYRYLGFVDTFMSLIREADVSIHINGHGGDELFGPLSSMAWSLYHSKHRNKLRNLYGFARVNKFKLYSFLKSIMNEDSIEKNLLNLKIESLDQTDFDVKYDAMWLPRLFCPNFVTNITKTLVCDLAKEYVKKGLTPSSEDRSVHEILEAVELHTNLQKDLNAMVPDDIEFEFWSPYTDIRFVKLAASLNIDERFNARVTKPLLAAIRSPDMPLDYFNRVDKGEYSKATFKEFVWRKEGLLSLFKSDCLLYRMGLLDKDKILQSIGSFSADGETYEVLMRIQILEYWLRGYNEWRIKNEV